MAKKTNCTINGKEYYRITRKIGMKRNKYGIWVDDRKTFYGSCKKEAEEKYQEYIHRKKSGQGVTGECLGQLLDQWIEEVFKYSDLSNSTKDHYIKAYEKLLSTKKLAGLPAGDITPLDLQQLYNDSSPESTVRELHFLLRRFFKYAELNGICRDITHSLTPPKSQKSAPQDNGLTVDVWEDLDLKKLLTALEGHRLRLLVLLAVNTGLRIGELLALTYEDIKDELVYVSRQLSEAPQADGSAETFYIDTPKTATSIRAVPLSKVIIEEIEFHEAWQRREMMEKGYRTEYLFTTSKGTWYRRRNIKKSLDRLYDRTGLPRHKFHSFRHTFGTNLSRAGIPIEETAQLMGHADISTTAKYYINVNADRKREAVEKIVSFSMSDKKVIN